MAPRAVAAAAQREGEISDLIKAVKDHRKFKQLACYSIQALDKSIDPETNRNTWRESVSLAIRLDAAAVVCDILQRHPGHENVLMICIECLRKLAIDKTNAVVIAEQNAVPYLFESIKANPELPEEVLHTAMSLLSNLCAHQKVSAMVLNEDTLTSVLGVLSLNRDPLVLSSCVSIVDKISSLVASHFASNKSGNSNGNVRGSVASLPQIDAKMASLNELLQSSCVAPMLKALESVIGQSDGMDESTEDFVVNHTRVLSRLAASNPDVQKQVKDAGGIDTYLHVSDMFRDSDRVNRVSSKLISKLMGGNATELMSTLQEDGLSTVAKERVLSLVATLSLDAANVDDIMASGGVSAMISSMEVKSSTRALEETARTVARLASTPKNIPKLVEMGAVGQICSVITALHFGAQLEMQTSMVSALNRVVSISPEQLNTVITSSGSVGSGTAASVVIPSLLTTLTANPTHVPFAKASLDFLGKMGGDLKDIKGVDTPAYCTALLGVLQGPAGTSDPSVASSCFKCLAGPSGAGGFEGASALLAAGAVPMAIAALNGVAAAENPAVAAAALNFMVGLARTTSDNAGASSKSGGSGLAVLQKSGCFEAVVECLGGHMHDAEVRRAAAEVIQMVASDDLIIELGGNLATFVDKFEAGNASEEEFLQIPPLVLSLGAISMVPSNVPLLADAGGVGPMTKLMCAVAEMKDCPSQVDLLLTFSSCLCEVAAAEPACLDPAITMKACVAVLTNHGGNAEVCTAALRLMRAAVGAEVTDEFMASQLEHVDNVLDSDLSADMLAFTEGLNPFAVALVTSGGIDAIATQVRLHPTDNPELLMHALEVYGCLAAHAPQRAQDIMQRSGRQLLRCLDEAALATAGSGAGGGSGGSGTAGTAGGESASPQGLSALVPLLSVVEICSSTPEGRAIASKMGAVKSVLSLLDATNAIGPSGEIASAACARALTAVVSVKDVTRVVERMQSRIEMLTDGEEAGKSSSSIDPAAMSAISDDVKKLGLLMLCGDFSDAIQSTGGLDSLVNVITFVDSAQQLNKQSSGGSGDKEAEELIHHCVTAFGRAAGSGHDIELPKSSVEVVPTLVRCLQDDPSTWNLLAIAALGASDASLLKALVQNGAVEALVPVLENLNNIAVVDSGGYFGNSSSSNSEREDQAAGIRACFSALSTFSLSSDGASAVVASGGLALVVDHLREELLATDTNTGSVISSAVAILHNAVASGKKSSSGESSGSGSSRKTVDVRAELKAAGVLNLVTDSLSQLQYLSMGGGSSGNVALSVGDVNAFAALQDLLAEMCSTEQQEGTAASGSDSKAANESTAKDILASGAIEQVNVLMRHNAFASSPTCALATSSLLGALCAADASSAALLKKMGCDQTLLQTMNANSTDVEVARACASAVGSVSGGGAEGGRATLLSVLDKCQENLDHYQALKACGTVAPLQASAQAASAATATTDASTALSLGAVTSSLQSLANLMMLEGAVDQSVADRLLTLSQASLACLSDLHATDNAQSTRESTIRGSTVVASSSSSSSGTVVASQAQIEAVAMRDANACVALTLMGRLANLDHVEVNTDAVAAASAAFFEVHEVTSDAVLASAVSCVGGVASSARGVQSIARHGLVARVQKKVQQRNRTMAGPQSKAQQLVASVAAQTMETLKTTAVSNAASLVSSEGGAAAIASILVGIAADLQQPKVLGVTLQQILKEKGGLQVLLEALCEMGPPTFGALPGSRRAVEAVIAAMLDERDSGAARLEVTTPAQALALAAASGVAKAAMEPLALAAVAHSANEGAGSKRSTLLKSGVSSAKNTFTASLIDKKAAPSSTSQEEADNTALEAALALPVAAAVVLLESLPSSSQGVAVLCATPGVLESVVASLESPNMAVAAAASGLLANLARNGAANVYSRLGECQAPKKLMQSLKRIAFLPEDEMEEEQGKQFLDCAAYGLNTCLVQSDAKSCNLESDSMRVLSAFAKKLTSAGYAYAGAQCEKASAILMEAYADGAEANLEKALKRLAELDGSHRMWQGVSDDGGQKVYYFNSSTNETTWERPPSHDVLCQELTNVMELATAIGSLETIDPGAVASGLVPLLTSHPRDGEVSTQVCKLLATACLSADHARELGYFPGAADLLLVLDNFMQAASATGPGAADSKEVDPMVGVCAAICHRLSSHRPFKAALSNKDYISVLNKVVMQYAGRDEAVAVRCLLTLANLTAQHSRSAANVSHALTCGVPKTLAAALRAHPNSRQVASASLYVLEYLLQALDDAGDDDDDEIFGDEEAIENIKTESIVAVVASPLMHALKTFGCTPKEEQPRQDDSSVEIFRDREAPQGFFLRCMRCLGSFSLVDACILVLAEQRACALLSAGLRQWRGAPEAVAVGLEVLSNLAAIEDDELDEQVTEYLIADDACEVVLEVITAFDTNVPILRVAYEALGNLGNDAAAAGKLVELGAVKSSSTAIQNFDYEKDLVAQVMKFLSVLSFDRRCVDEISELGMISIISQGIEARKDDEDFVLDALTVLSNAVPNPQVQADVIKQPLFWRMLFDLLSSYADSADVVKQVTVVCIRLSAQEDASALLANEGMPYFMRTAAGLGMRDTGILALLFELLFYLAFAKENIMFIVQHGGVRVLCDVMGVDEYMQDTSLMTKAVGMMDNVVSADEEFADIVFEKGGRKLVQGVQALHQQLSSGADDEDDSQEVVDNCVSCLLSMDAMAKQKEQAQASKTGRAALFARLGGDAVDLGGGRSNMKERSGAVDGGSETDPEPEEDPLKEHRALLGKGVYLKCWSKGVPMEQHFYVPQEFNSLMLRDATAAKTKPGVRVPLRSIDKVEPGKGEGHVKKGVVFSGNTNHKAEQCIVLLDKPKGRTGAKGKELACLSFETTEECEVWSAALSRLLQTSRCWPHRLKGTTADS